MRAATLLLISTILFTTSCKKDSSTTYTVKYTIMCPDCTVQYIKDQAGTVATELHKNDAWSYTFTGKKGQLVSVTATNTGSTSATIESTITINNTDQRSSIDLVDVGSPVAVADSSL